MQLLRLLQQESTRIQVELEINPNGAVVLLSGYTLQVKIQLEY